MNDEYSADLLTLTDDDGNEYEFEIIAQLEYKDNDYVAIVPFDDDNGDEPEDEEALFMIMRSTVVDGEEFMDLIEDEKELDVLVEMFEELLADDYDILEELEEDEL